MQFLFAVMALCVFLPAGKAGAEDAAKLRLNGKGWYQFGRIMHSTDTLVEDFNYQGNWSHGSGAQFTVTADIDENWQAAMGLGGFQFHNPQGSVSKTALSNLGFAPYITEGRVTFTTGPRGESPWTLNLGLFPYHYNPDVRNLGSYLFRGPVYPGILFSEFESQSIDPTIANMLGIQVRHKIGGFFTHDLILRSETELPPVFDFSLAYLANMNFGGVFEVGGGANLYRLIPIQRDLTLLRDRATFGITPTAKPYDGDYAYIDSTGDTTLLTHQGVKVMGRLSFDPKPLLGTEVLGPRDLKIYAEAAVIGIKDYKGVYPDIMQRIPVMLGFNIPTFRLLDEATLEVEWYGAPFRDDYRRLYVQTSPTPVSNGNYQRESTPDGRLVSDTTKAFKDFDVTNMKKDDIKWSLYLSKTFMGSLKMSMQAANDHYKPYTHVNSPAGTTQRFESAFTTLQDWYLMARVGFVF